MRRLIVLCLIFLSLLSFTGNVGAVDIKIDFDNVVAPGLFIDTNPLRDEYATRGVRFRGLAENDGGAILNPNLANFGVPAYSGQNVLAFNSLAKMANGGVPQQPEFILFDDLWKTVSIYVACTNGTDRFVLSAYDSSGKMVFSDEEQVSNKDGWVSLSVEWALGIQKVELTRQESGSPTFVADNLELTTRVVPEPGTMLLLGLGIIGIGFVRRRH
jgi:hypothetical protein